MLGHHALVTDFGVAKALSAARQSSLPGGMFAPGTTSTGLAIGTPAYMAPEQLAADPDADHRVDLYAAGLLAYELLLGESPFRADSPQATLAAQLTRMPTPLHEVRPDVPQALSMLIEQCLAKEPEQRPATADVLLADLEAVIFLVSNAGAVPGDGSAPAYAGMTTPRSTTPQSTIPLTAPLAAPAAETVALRSTTPAAPRRRPTALLGGALLGMGIVLVGGWAVVRSRGPHPTAAPVAVAAVPAAPAPLPAPAASPMAAPAIATSSRLTRDDSLAIAAAVERRLASEERTRRQRAVMPMAPVEAESLRAQAWQHYADSLRDALRGMGRVIVGMPQLRRLGDARGMPGVPDSATIAALAAAGANAAMRFENFSPGPGNRPSDGRNDMRVFNNSDQRRDLRADALARFGERLPAPKAGIRRVLVLDLTDGNRREMHEMAGDVSDAIRRSVAQHGYEVIDGDAVRDLTRSGVPEPALAAITHSGAVISGTVFAQRDSQIGAVVIVHDPRAGARSLHLPRVSPDLATRVLGQTAGTEVLGLLDRIRWDMSTTPSPSPTAAPTTPAPPAAPKMP